MDSGRRVLTGLIWRFMERCGAQVVSFIVSVILARILSPSEYGQIAIVLAFITILNVFVDAGFGNALIQKKNADDTDFSTVFYFNIVCCSVLYLLLCITAPAIARFCNDASLTAVSRVLGLTVVISGVKNIQQAFVSKHLLFRKFFFSTLTGTVVSAVIGIVMAVSGFGVWAIVAQHLSNALIDTTVLWFTVKWRPKGVFSFDRFKDLFGYGYKLLLSSLMNTLYENCKQLFIGKYYTSADLAFYNRGNQFPMLLMSNISSSIDSVLFPSMSERQDDKEKLYSMMKKSMQAGTFILWPLLAGMAVTARPLINIVLTSKWSEAAVYMQIFCFFYSTYPLQAVNLNAIKAVGRSDVFLKLEILETVVGIIMLLCVLKKGVIWIAVITCLWAVFCVLAIAYEARKLFDYGLGRQIRELWKNITGTVLMGIAAYLPGAFVQEDWIILVQIAAGILVYFLMARITRNEAMAYFTHYITVLLGSFSLKRRGRV